MATALHQHREPHAMMPDTITLRFDTREPWPDKSLNHTALSVPRATPVTVSVAVLSFLELSASRSGRETKDHVLG